MVRGFESFREWFRGYEEQYAIIGGTACDLLMIELFTRKPDAVILPDESILTPLPIDDNVSSLSAILLDENYYEFLRQGRIPVSGVMVLDASHLIPFKAKAWIDLTQRKAAGEGVDSRNIRKHKNDVFRLTELLKPNMKPLNNLPASIKFDMNEFIIN